MDTNKSKVGNSVNPQNPVRCRVCSNQFANMKQLKKHVEEQNHYKDPVFKCKECNTIFPTFEITLKHYQETDHFPFHCRVCNTGFTMYDDMMKHIVQNRHYTKKDEDCVTIIAPITATTAPITATTTPARPSATPASATPASLLSRLAGGVSVEYHGENDNDNNNEDITSSVINVSETKITNKLIDKPFSNENVFNLRYPVVNNEKIDDVLAHNKRIYELVDAALSSGIHVSTKSVVADEGAVVADEGAVVADVSVGVGVSKVLRVPRVARIDGFVDVLNTNRARIACVPNSKLSSYISSLENQTTTSAPVVTTSAPVVTMARLPINSSTALARPSIPKDPMQGVVKILEYLSKTPNPLVYIDSSSIGRIIKAKEYGFSSLGKMLEEIKSMGLIEILAGDVTTVPAFMVRLKPKK